VKHPSAGGTRDRATCCENPENAILSAIQEGEFWVTSKNRAARSPRIVGSAQMDPLLLNHSATTQRETESPKMKDFRFGIEIETVGASYGTLANAIHTVVGGQLRGNRAHRAFG
jgi:hypothetical protein